MSRITKVIPRENYQLEVQLDTGSCIVLNLESRLGTIRFGILSDIELFRQATTDGSYIRWDNNIEISVSEVFELAKNERNSVFCERRM